MKNRKLTRFISVLTALFFVYVMVAPASVSAAEATVNLRSTSTFAVLAGTTITNTGTTVINGDAGSDVGVSPGSAITGEADISILGTFHEGDAVALQAKDDLILAYDDAASRTPTRTFTETDNQLGGEILTSGVYAFGHADTANLTAAEPLILDAEGDPEAVFIFQASSDLVMASGSVVELRNGARYCRVFWQVGSDVTLNTDSHFVGHIFALNSIWVRTGAEVNGQLLARNGEVTLQANTIINGLCAAAATPTPTATATPTPTATPTTTPTTAPTTTPTTAPTPTTTPTTTPTPTPTGPELIKTGESSGNNTILGLIMLGLAGATILILFKKQTGEVDKSQHE